MARCTQFWGACEKDPPRRALKFKNRHEITPRVIEFSSGGGTEGEGYFIFTTSGPFLTFFMWPNVRSGPGKPNQRKVSSWTFRRGIPEQKFNVNRACFPKEKRQNSHKKGRSSWTFRFGPFFRFVCRGHSWKWAFSTLRLAPPWRNPLKHRLSRGYCSMFGLVSLVS